MTHTSSQFFTSVPARTSANSGSDARRRRSLKRTFAAAALALGVSLGGVATAFAWQPRVEGQPLSFSPGSTAGVYFWHNNPAGLSLRTTDPPGVHHEYTGTITTDGAFVNVTPVQLEADDSVSVDPSGHTLTFDFHTFSDVDGVDYEIVGGTAQHLDLQMDGAEISPSSVFLGSAGVHPEYMPFLVCRSAGSAC